MNSFEQRLAKAVERGENRREDRAREERQKKLSVEELKKLHTGYRLQFSEHIESVVNRLPNHFPGFQFETIYGDRGWGAACTRDDIGRGVGGKRANYYSRIEVAIRPFSDLHVVDLAAKATVRNKEIFRRNHFELINDVDPETFLNLIDVWVLEYAEQYAAATK